MADYTIRNARYAKGMMLVVPGSDGSGMKNRAARICEALKGKWTNREKGYVMSPSKAKQFEEHMRSGRDADIKFDSVYTSHYELADSARVKNIQNFAKAYKLKLASSAKPSEHAVWVKVSENAWNKLSSSDQALVMKYLEGKCSWEELLAEVAP